MSCAAALPAADSRGGPRPWDGGRGWQDWRPSWRRDEVWEFSRRDLGRVWGWGGVPGVGQGVGTGQVNRGGWKLRGPCEGLSAICKLPKLPATCGLTLKLAATWVIFLTQGSWGTAMRPLPPSPGLPPRETGDRLLPSRALREEKAPYSGLGLPFGASVFPSVNGSDHAALWHLAPQRGL